MISLLYPPTAETPWHDFTGDGLADLIARRRSDWSLWLWSALPGLGFLPARQIGLRWGGFNSIVRSGDWSGDGNDDVVARVTSTGELRLYPGNGSGGFGPWRRIGTGWGGVSEILAPGDLNSDGRADLLGRFADGKLWLYPGDGRGGYSQRFVVGLGWAASTTIITPGDWNGDGADDLIARRLDGTLWLYPGNGRGSFPGIRKIGTGWSSFSSISGPGDVDDDGLVDLVAWTTAGRLFLYPGNGRGGFGRSIMVGHGWSGYDFRG